MRLQPSRDGVALYHVVLANEGFEGTASNLFQLIRKAQAERPDQKRTLYLDIEGHRNADGGFDAEMLELQSKFATEFLMQFLSRIVMPLATLDNPRPQRNDLPDELILFAKDGKQGEGPPDSTTGKAQ